MAHGLLYGASFKNGVLSFTDKQGRSLCEASFPRYLTLTAVEDNSSVALKNVGTVTNTYEYRKNGGSWTAYELTTSGTVISLNAGDRVEWRCTAGKSTFSENNYVQFVMRGKISASNPITSMISPALNHKTIWNKYACCNLFKECTSLTQAPELPATTLETYCYASMFYGCKSLTQAPALPATTLAPYCYRDMFRGCTSLTQAPALPATTLSNCCYEYMFSSCTSLTKAPELPATTLAVNCYENMFYGCTRLTQAPALPATTLTDYCYENMFKGCTSLTQAPALPATTLADHCYASMFYGCKSLTQAPALPATTLANSCYWSMFNGCTSLNEVRVYATGSLPSGSYTAGWLSGVSSTGDFYCNPNTSWSRGGSGIPSGWNRFILDAEDTGTTTTMYHNGAPETVRVGTSSYGTGYSAQGWAGFTALADMHALGYTLSTQTIVTLYEDEHRISVPSCDANDDDGFTETMYDVGDGYGFLTIGRQNDKRIYTEPKPFTGLTLTATKDNSSVALTNINTFNKFRVDTGSGWSDYTFGTVINLNAGQSCRWDCPEHPTTQSYFGGNVHFKMTGKIEASGNCLSMLRRNFENEPTLDKGAFCYLFLNCTSLVQAPELPFTTLADSCYCSMFEGCTGLTQAPALPATTLADSCYLFMFYSCKSLNEVRVSATDISASQCTMEWLKDVSSTGDFYCNPNTSWSKGWSGIPSGWRRLSIDDYPTT